MRLPHLPFITLFITLATIAPAENLRKVAESNERGFANALRTKNAGWFETVAAPDYYQMNVSGGKQTRVEAISQMKDMFSMGKVTTIKTKVLKVTPKGAGMTVLVDAHIVIRGTPSGAKKLSTIDSKSRYEETWSKDKGKWRIHRLKTIKTKTLMDGKAIPSG